MISSDVIIGDMKGKFQKIEGTTDNVLSCNAGRCADASVRMPDATVASRCIPVATSHSQIAIAIA